MQTEFHNELGTYIKNQDKVNAKDLILNELAIALVKDKNNFIEVLRSADISVFDNSTDLQIIDLFIKNAPSNKKLLLGASYLINHRNQSVNFDGEQQVSDSGVKSTFKTFDDFFSVDGEEYSYAGWSDAIKSIADVGGAVSGGIMKSQGAKQRGSSMQLEKQTDARKQMIQSVIAQKQAETQQKQADKSKTNRTLLIAGGITLTLLIGVGIFIAIKKRQK